MIEDLDHEEDGVSVSDHKNVAIGSLRARNFSPIAQKMMNAGYSREQVCALVKLHRPNFECPKSLVPDAPPVVVIQ